MVTVPPIAVGYIAGSDDDAVAGQRSAVIAHGRAEGYAFARIVADRSDGYTISQLVAVARRNNAQIVIIPATTTLAAVRERLARELTAIRAGCVVVSAPDATTSSAPVSRLGGGRRRRSPRHVRTSS